MFSQKTSIDHSLMALSSSHLPPSFHLFGIYQIVFVQKAVCDKIKLNNLHYKDMSIDVRLSSIVNSRL